jgi:molecular chaperone GrpE
MSESKDNDAKPTAEADDVPAASASGAGAVAAPSAGQAGENSDAGIAPPAEAAAAELEKAIAERDENYNRYLRAVADLDTYRRRVAREKDEMRQFGTRDLIEALLPVYEHLGLAIASTQQVTDAESIAKGVSLVLEQFKSVLASKGLVEINPDVGADFDPHQEESIGHAPHPAVPAEKIVQVVRVGFALNGRILRPASVLLSSGPAPTEAAQPAS